MIVYVYDRFGKQKYLISDFIEFYSVEELGSFDFIDLTIIGDHVEKGDYLVWKDMNDKWHENLVSTESTIHDKRGLIQNIHAPNSITETNRIAFTGADNTGYSSGNQSRAINDLIRKTRWNTGRLDNIEGSTFYLRNETVYEGLCDVFITSYDKAYYTTDISIGQNGVSNRVLNFVSDIGEDTGLIYDYGFDADSVERTFDIDEVCTRIYAFGAKTDDQNIPDEDKDIYARYGQEERVTIEWATGGTNYIEDNAAKAKYGIMGKDGEIQHSEGIFYFDDVYSYPKLLTLARRKLEEVKVPRVSYKAKIFTFFKEVYGIPPLRLGDYVTVRDNVLGDIIKTRIVYIKRDYINTYNTEIELGNTTRTFSIKR